MDIREIQGLTCFFPTESMATNEDVDGESSKDNLDRILERSKIDQLKKAKPHEELCNFVLGNVVLFVQFEENLLDIMTRYKVSKHLMHCQECKVEYDKMKKVDKFSKLLGKMLAEPEEKKCYTEVFLYFLSLKRGKAESHHVFTAMRYLHGVLDYQLREKLIPPEKSYRIMRAALERGLNGRKWKDFLIPSAIAFKKRRQTIYVDSLDYKVKIASITNKGIMMLKESVYHQCIAKVLPYDSLDKIVEMKLASEARYILQQGTARL